MRDTQKTERLQNALLALQRFYGEYIEKQQVMSPTRLRAAWEALNTAHVACGLELEVPYDYMCPISLDLMFEPIRANDTRTYDRPSLDELVARRMPSPFNREIKRIRGVGTNEALRLEILDYIGAFIKERENFCVPDADEPTNGAHNPARDRFFFYPRKVDAVDDSNTSPDKYTDDDFRAFCEKNDVVKQWCVLIFLTGTLLCGFALLTAGLALDLTGILGCLPLTLPLALGVCALVAAGATMMMSPLLSIALLKLKNPLTSQIVFSTRTSRYNPSSIQTIAEGLNKQMLDKTFVDENKEALTAMNERIVTRYEKDRLGSSSSSTELSGKLGDKSQPVESKVQNITSYLGASMFGSHPKNNGKKLFGIICEELSETEFTKATESDTASPLESSAATYRC